MTVYPRSCPDPQSPLGDHHAELASIGFETNVMGELYLEHSDRWIRYPWHLPIPIPFANKLLFIRSDGISTATPDDVLDHLF